ncbi:MAG: hypothetical protein KF720_06440 [Rubrivivax sp.]|nr:hypothetical protein [Rubrivivax sp.]
MNTAAYRQGPSFAPGAKVAATLLMLLLAAMAWRNADHPALRQLSAPVLLLALLAAAIVAAGYWSVLRSHTAIDGAEIRQIGLLPRRVALADIAQLKLVRLRGLEWLVTPRLVVRARGLGTSTFYCADAGVLDAVEQLSYGRPPPPPTDA